MSLYRESGGRRARALIAVGVAALAIGLAGGFAAGRASAPEPDLAEQVAELREAIRPALSALELVSIEYPEAVANGEIRAETEYSAARSQVDAARSTLDAVAPDLSQLDPVAVEEAQSRLDELAGAVESVDDPGSVDRVAGEAVAAIEAAAGSGR